MVNWFVGGGVLYMYCVHNDTSAIKFYVTVGAWASELSPHDCTVQ